MPKEKKRQLTRLNRAQPYKGEMKMIQRSSRCFLSVLIVLLCCSSIEAGYALQGKGIMSTPDEGMSVDDYMRLWYHLKYCKDCNDYWSHGWVIKRDKRGYIRKQEWLRNMIILRRKSDDLDFKDVVTVINPQNVKGLSVLTWTYISPNRDQEVWLWLPSLRKIRRVSQSEGDDSFIGADSTYDEVMTRKWEDETYKLVGDEQLPSYHSWYTNKTYYGGLKCCVIEATTKKKDWYYEKRRVFFDKDTALNVYEDYYDETGKKFKTVFRLWSEHSELRYRTYLMPEFTNLRENHSSSLPIEETKFDQGLKENFFSARVLMRSKW